MPATPKRNKSDASEASTNSTIPSIIIVEPEDLPGPKSPGKETLLDKAKAKIQGFGTLLRPSRSRSSLGLSSSEVQSKSQEYLPITREPRTSSLLEQSQGDEFVFVDASKKKNKKHLPIPFNIRSRSMEFTRRAPEEEQIIKEIGVPMKQVPGMMSTCPSCEGGYLTPRQGLSTAISREDIQAKIESTRQDVSAMGRLTDSETNGAAQASIALNNLDATLNPLKTFNSVVKGLSNLHPYAKISLSVLSWASQAIIAQANRDEAIQDLQQKISNIYQFMIEDDRLERLVWMKDILPQTAQVILECAKFINSYSQPSFLHRFRKSVFSHTDELIIRYNKALDGLVLQFQNSALGDGLVTVHEIRSQVLTLHEGVKAAHEDVKRVLVDIGRIGDDMHLSEIAYAKGAGMDTTKACLDGTRGEILQEIIEWVDNPDANAPNILWLSGVAGTGKSAIAHTVARWMKDCGSLGSCFCFKKGDDKRSFELFSTIARDLVSHDFELKQILANVVAGDPSLCTTEDVTQQWQKLILQPLLAVSCRMIGRLVIVVDALDEIAGDKSGKHIISVLAKEAARLPANIRILLTSRPHPDIDRAFQGVKHVKHKSMDEIPSDSTESDIRSYLSVQLSDAADKFTDEEVVRLAKRADGLFEWARLACNYIKLNEAGVSQKERFNELMSREQQEGTDLLDDMYNVILREIMGKRPKGLALKRFRSVMRHVLFTREPLPLDSFVIMHRAVQTDYDAELILRPMASLLSGISDRSTPIRPLHSSFHDYLTDRERSKVFFVHGGNADLSLAQASLRIMKQELRFNICQLETSYVRNSEIHDLDQRVKKHILPHLSYSCRFWAHHVESTAFNPDLAEELKAVLIHERLLFWVEALSALHSVKLLPMALAAVVKWLDACGDYKEVAAIAKEGIQLARNFGSLIAESIPHLYLSVLPFLPDSSVLSRTFTDRFPRIARVATGRPVSWPPAERTLVGHTDSVMSVAFSNDGKWVVSGSMDSTIRIWDTEIGLPVGDPLRGHGKGVNAVAFSPDGKQIVSGSRDCTICVWDVATGSRVAGPFEGHKDKVLSVVMLPDGKRIVSGSADRMIFIWDMERSSQERTSCFSGHTDWVRSVAVSRDGKRIVSGSDDHTICVWDAESGLQVGESIKLHSDYVMSVAFSPDGNKILSGSRDKTLCVWDLKNSRLACGPLAGHTYGVNSAAFSPDGKWIISGSTDYTVHIWNAETGEKVGAPFKRHIGSVSSVAISADGRRVVSGSTDKTLHIWDVDARVMGNSPTRGHSNEINSVAFSPDGKNAVSGSDDGTICIWDTMNGSLNREPIKGHSGRVWCVAFSPDGQRIASCSNDRSISIWDVKTGLKDGNSIKHHSGTVYCIAFSPDGKLIASGSGDRTICIWDVATKSLKGGPLKKHSGKILSLAFSQSGRIVSGSSDATICIWDAMPSSWQFGKSLTGHKGDVKSVSISKDGKKIISGSEDQIIGIWDAETGSQLHILEGHTSKVLTVALSFDEERIVSGSADKTIRLWDAKTGCQIGSPFRGHTGSVFSVAFSPHESKIISGSSDVTIRVWTLNPDSSVFEHINLSSKKSCSLLDAIDLFNGNSNEEKKWRETVYLNEDGWFVGPGGRHLLSVPSFCHRQLYMPGTVLIMPQSAVAVELDLSRMAHGPKWYSCYEGSTV